MPGLLDLDVATPKEVWEHLQKVLFYENATNPQISEDTLATGKWQFGTYFNFNSTTNPSTGTNYSYKITAIDNGRLESPFSNTYMGFVADTKMKTAPSNVQVDYNNSKNAVQIRWEIEATPDFHGCMVYRKEGNGEFLPVSGLILDDSYSDAGISKGKKYYYEVRSLDTAGNFARSAPLTVEIPLPQK